MNKGRDKLIAQQWAHSVLSLNRYAILDTETTGLRSTDEVCQLGILTESEEYQTLVRPTVPIGKGAFDVHGISDADVKNAPTFDEVLAPALKVIGDRDLYIFNAAYDLRMIKQSLAVHGITVEFPKHRKTMLQHFLNGRPVNCVMLWYSQWVGEVNQSKCSYKWQRLPGGDHSALGDCRATVAVIDEMSK